MCKICDEYRDAIHQGKQTDQFYAEPAGPVNQRSLMSMDASPKPKPDPIPPIKQAADENEKLIYELKDTIGRLQAKLYPVMRNPNITYEVPKATTEPEAPRSPLLEWHISLSSHIRDITRWVNEIASEIEA